MTTRYRLWLTLAVAICCAGPIASQAYAHEASKFHLIVMDPLAAPLSCPCVEGYAQRKYEYLAKHLEGSLGRQVQVTFAESLATALKKTKNGAHLIIGKDSVVRSDARAAKLRVNSIAALADKKGSTEQHGLIVVRSDAAAKKTADLVGYEIIFGPAECDEKHAAAVALIKKAGLPVPKKLTIDQACSDGAAKVVELGAKKKIAAVISSYAAPLLEGCGTIKKGDLRVVGKTKPVPFITAFATEALDADERGAVKQALFSVIGSPEVCQKLESLVGFVEPQKKSQPRKSKRAASVSSQAGAERTATPK